MDPRNQSPFHALPPVVVALAGAIAIIELAFQAGAAGLLGGAQAVGWRVSAISDWAVSDAVWSWMLGRGAFPPAELARFATYPFLHGGFGHAAFVTVFVLAFGNAVEPFYPGWRFLALFLASAVAGALAFVLLFDARGPLYGGYPAAYGLIGAFTFLTRRGLTRAPPERAFLLIGLLLAIQPVFGLVATMGFGWVPDWSADAAGALAGYGLAAALFPGAAHRFRDRMRRR